MKKYLLGAVALCFLMQAKAQDTEETVKTKVREVGLTASSLTNGFGLTYRVGNEKMVWRFNALSGQYNQGGNVQDDYYQNTTIKSLNLSTSFGVEFRKTITEKLTWRTGVDLGFSMSSYSRQENNDSTIYRSAYSRDLSDKRFMPTVKLVLGVNYQVAENIILGAEVLPFIGMEFMKYKRSETYADVAQPDQLIDNESTGFRIGLDSSPVLLSAVVRF